MVSAARRFLSPAFVLLVLAGILLSACGNHSYTAVVTTPVTSVPVLTPTTTGTLVPTVSPSPTSTTVPPTATSTPATTPTPLVLPQFQSRIIRNNTPLSYIADPCQALYARWNPANSQPGTVLLPIMYHSILKDIRKIEDDTSISASDFRNQLEYARSLGFQTVTTAQVIDFLYHNAPIPKLSLLLIVDDRRPGVIREHFLPLLEEFDWTVTLAYITGIGEDWEWQEMERLYASGRLDVQAHGYLHRGDTYFTPQTPPETIQQEVFDPIPVIFQHFGVRPYAFIYPGGNFTEPAVNTIRLAGYRIAFTTYSRGPILFNWVPQGDEEAALNQPLHLLPRAWSPAAWVSIDHAYQLSQQAAAFAEQNKTLELSYYKQYCSAYPPLTQE